MCAEPREQQQAPTAARRLARVLAVVSAVFSLTVAVLLVINYEQLQTVDPLKNATLERLIEALAEQPENQQLRDDIREFDLMRRKAFFTRQWQLNTGAYLLLAGMVVLIACLKVLGAFSRPAPAPGSLEPAENEWRSARRTRVLMALCGCLAAGTLAASILFGKLLERTEDGGIPGAVGAPGITESAAPEPEEIPAPAPAAAANYLDEAPVRENWPSFRGPGVIGISGCTDAPLRFNGATGEGIIWKTAIPRPGRNSPVIWDDRIFLAGSDGLTDEVYCLDRTTGAIRWRRQVDDIPGSPAEHPPVFEDTGYAPSTMAVDGSGVFAIFPTGDVICFEPDGRRRWARNLGLPDNHYGHASSLLVYRRLLLVQYDYEPESSLLALSVDTGETVWETKRPVVTSWASPIAVHAGRPMIILCAMPLVAAYDPATGAELWRADCLMGEIGASPAYGGGLVFASSQYGVMAAIDAATGTIAWHNDEFLSDAPSPVAARGCLFMPTSYGAFSCLDAQTGELYWTREFDRGSYSSPICVGDRIYWFEETGLMHVFKADTTYTELGGGELGERTFATPAAVDGLLYVRGEQHLFCIGGTDGDQ